MLVGQHRPLYQRKGTGDGGAALRRSIVAPQAARAARVLQQRHGHTDTEAARGHYLG
jgi:hypothetical protein